MPTPLPGSVLCPHCHEADLVRIKGARSFKSATHACPQCKSEFRASFTPRSLWSIPAAALGFAAIIGIGALTRDSPNVPAFLRVVLTSAAVGGTFGFSSRAMLKGMVYRSCQK